MTAKILDTKKDPFSVNALKNYAEKYIFRIRDITDHGQNGPRTKRTTAGQNGPR